MRLIIRLLLGNPYRVHILRLHLPRVSPGAIHGKPFQGYSENHKLGLNLQKYHGVVAFA